MKIDQIEIDPVLSSIFPIDPDILGSIITHMQKFGYDSSQPLVLWKDKGTIVDGHTRYQAALKVGLKDIPVVEHEFSTLTDAIAYSIHNQKDRRNLSSAEFIKIVKLLKTRIPRGRPKKDEKGKVPEALTSAELADKFGVSKSLVDKARFVIDHGDEELIKSIEDGKTSISTAAKEITTNLKKKKKLIKETEEDKPQFSLISPDYSEFASYAWNIIIGCSKNCYFCASRAMLLTSNGSFDPTFFEKNLGASKHTPFSAEGPDDRRRVLVAPHGDLFSDGVVEEWREKIFNEISNDKTGWTYIVISRYYDRVASVTYPDNVWLGLSVSTQQEYDDAVVAFAEAKAKVKFLLFVPLLEKISPDENLKFCDFITIGSMDGISISNSELSGFVPDWNWVECLLFEARKHQVGVYMFRNLTCRPRETSRSLR